MKPKFVIQSGYEDRGIFAILRASLDGVVDMRYTDDPEAVNIDFESPLGSVEWVEDVISRMSHPDLGRFYRIVKPNYVPCFLEDMMTRSYGVLDCDGIEDLGNGMIPFDEIHVKPFHRHKMWDAMVINEENAKDFVDRIKCMRSWVTYSEVVRFRNEYRYYVVDGEVISGWWYWGDTQDETQTHEGSTPPDAPALPDTIQWPSNFSGAVDFGELYDTGELVLVENNKPYSCGWYGEGDSYMDYVNFVKGGWEYIKNKE